VKFLLRSPEAAYLDTHLWLPKRAWSLDQLRSSLQYFVPRTGEVLDAFDERPNHILVPRNYLNRTTLGQLPYKVYDARFTNFPKVSFKSRVTLDALSPEHTYQREGAASLLSTYDGILTLRCGAGKTIVGLHAAAQVGQPILVVVNDKGLARQWMEEIEFVLGIPAREIGRIGGDGAPFNWEGSRITVAIVNTIAGRAVAGTLPPELTKYFGVILFDEVHTLAAPYFNKAIPPFHGRRWGLSATPNRDDGMDSLLKYSLGDVVFQYLMPELTPIVYFRKLNTILNMTLRSVYDHVTDSTGEIHFGRLFDYLSTLEDRNALIARDVKRAVSEGRQVLVLTHSRAMCEQLERLLPEAGVCHGDIKEGERLRRIKEMNPVIAIMRLGKQALNKPKLDTLFVVEPFQKEQMLQQVMGRILRYYAGKKHPHMIFYEDSHIALLFKLCQKLRTALNRWPAHKGGRILFYNK